jgi:phospholipid/cholesterol/gamma-HCH transport system substrate-binding protein
MFRRAHRVNPAFIGAGLFVLLLASLAFAFVSHKGIPGRDYTYATVAFNDLSAGLRVGSDVRIQGVRVGQVHDTAYEDGEARAELQLPDDMRVYQDATARIRSRSALGQLYVDIDPGSATAGPLGSTVLPKSRTTSLVELDTVLDALDPEARAGLATGLKELGAGLGGRGQDLNDLIGLAPDLLADLGKTTAALGSDDADLAAFLVAAERLASRFSGREKEITSLLAQSADVMDAFNTQAGQALRKTLEAAPGALDELRSGLNALTPVAADARSAFRALTPAAEALGQATPLLRNALTGGVAPFSSLPHVSGLAVPAFEGLTGVARDARPLVPEFGEAFHLARGPLELLVPYGPEIDLFFDNMRDSFAGGDSHGNWLRTITIVVGADNVGGNTTAPNPLVNRNPYPKPGEAATDNERFQPGGNR